MKHTFDIYLRTFFNRIKVDFGVKSFAIQLDSRLRLMFIRLDLRLTHRHEFSWLEYCFRFSYRSHLITRPQFFALDSYLKRPGAISLIWYFFNHLFYKVGNSQQYWNWKNIVLPEYTLSTQTFWLWLASFKKKTHVPKHTIILRIYVGIIRKFKRIYDFIAYLIQTWK